MQAALTLTGVIAAMLTLPATPALASSATSATAAAAAVQPGHGRLVPPGTGSPDIEQVRQSMSAGLPTWAKCWERVRIYAPSNGRYVAVEKEGMPLGYTGLLRARTLPAELGTWEEFKVCRVDETWETQIWSYGSPMMMVMASTIPGTPKGLLLAYENEHASGNHVTFTTIKAPYQDGATTSTWFYSKSEGLYVSNQLDYKNLLSGSLRARLGSVGPWEWFTWI
nr:hypothetical protein GCM10020063_016800 [Dactylosporangium thailandense]